MEIFLKLHQQISHKVSVVPFGKEQKFMARKFNISFFKSQAETDSFQA